MADYNPICKICSKPISPEEDSRQLGCGHRYHTTCMGQQFASSNTCPICSQIEQAQTVPQGVGPQGAQQTCVICQEVITENSTELHCNHFFHKGCIDQYLESVKNECPVCRIPVIHGPTPYIPPLEAFEVTPPDEPPVGQPLIASMGAAQRMLARRRGRGGQQMVQGPRLSLGNVSQEVCSLCNQPMPERTLQCNHMFHNQCIDDWFLTRDVCPDCHK